MNLDKSYPRLLYASAEAVQFMEEMNNNPAAQKTWKQELADRMSGRKQ